ncbi:TPA: DNA topoisomerase IV subunit B, partial [Salmonella enterica]|nr:DNA topoisomerase IV subunit B [Salmonella enterica]
MSEKPNNYDDSTIKVLSPLAAIRKRPGMYIGDTEFAAYTLAREGIENGSDEAKAGFADYIRIIL